MVGEGGRGKQDDCIGFDMWVWMVVVGGGGGGDRITAWFDMLLIFFFSQKVLKGSGFVTRHQVIWMTER